MIIGFAGGEAKELLREFVGLYLLKEVDSTQDEAKRRLQESNPVLVLAERQSRGRGRQGRVWESPPGGLWFSMGFRERKSDIAGNITLLPLLTGVAVARGLRALRFDARIKWPNDILVHNKKVAGILIEVEDAGPHSIIVIGIGINVNIPERELQGKLKGVSVGTLEGIAGHPLEQDRVLLQVLQHFFPLWRHWKEGHTESILRGWKELSVTLGRPVTIITADGHRIEGTAVGLDRDGALLVRTAAGQLRRVYEGHVI